MDQLQENLKIAGEDMIPICQDTGMAVLFVEVGQDVHVADGLIEDAIKRRCKTRDMLMDIFENQL